MSNLPRSKAPVYSIVTVLLIFLIATSAWSTKTEAPQLNLHPKLDLTPATASIKVDGVLNEVAWRTAGHAVNFVERYPGDNVAPKQATEAMITYDEDYLYIAFKCDDDPATVRATMCQRDNIFNGDDKVGVWIDTYGDASWAYGLFVNPYGVQGDILWSSVGGDDFSYDLIWKSAAQITPTGYDVELAIPFSGMRFPNKDVQSWKIDFRRSHPRESYREYSWVAYDKNEKCWACQMGTVDGISGVHPGRGVEILPDLVTSKAANLEDPYDLGSAFQNHDAEAELGIGAKYSISSDVTIEGSYNPDFSQIEADAAQIDVNQTIALFYPERRPFFQEGSDIFRTLFNSFYTRTVYDPQFTAKLTGRKEGYTFGYLTAVDERTPYIIPLEEGSITRASGKSYVNVLRLNKTVGHDSRLGVMLTDRRWDGGGSGSILSFDTDLRLTPTYSVVAQYVFSHTGEPSDTAITSGLEGIRFDNDRYTAAFDGESYSGDALISQFRRQARNWNFAVNYDFVEPDYRTETGFDPWNNYKNLFAYTNYNFFPKGGIVERITPNIYFDRRWNFNGRRKWAHFNSSLSTRLRFAQTNFAVNYNVGSETWSNTTLDDLWNVNVNLNTRPGDRLGFYVSYTHGIEAAVLALSRGDLEGLSVGADIKPIDRLTIEPNFVYEKMDYADSTGNIYKGYIARTRFQLQATTELSVRLVVQYNDFGEQWEVDPLITYRLSPFSVFYFGSTYDYDRNIDPERNLSEWRLTDRRFFAKLQYLFQI